MPKAMPKTHYDRHSATFCGANSTNLTTDPEKVTCDRCKNAIAGIKGSNRQQGDRPKKSVTLRIDKGLWEQVQGRAIARRTSCIAIVEDVLKKYFEED
jgi:hypothetical protein